MALCCEVVRLRSALFDIMIRWNTRIPSAAVVKSIAATFRPSLRLQSSFTLAVWVVPNIIKSEHFAAAIASRSLMTVLFWVCPKRLLCMFKKGHLCGERSCRRVRDRVIQSNPAWTKY